MQIKAIVSSMAVAIAALSGVTNAYPIALKYGMVINTDTASMHATTRPSTDSTC